MPVIGAWNTRTGSFKARFTGMGCKSSRETHGASRLRNRLSDDLGKTSDDYLTIPDDLFCSMQHVTGRPASAFFLGNAKFDEPDEVTVGSVARDGKQFFAFLAREFLALDQQCRHLLLSHTQLLLHGRRHDLASLTGRDTESLQIVSRSREDYLKVAGVRCKSRLVEAVVNHLIVHTPESAAAFLDAVKE